MDSSPSQITALECTSACQPAMLLTVAGLLTIILISITGWGLGADAKYTGNHYIAIAAILQWNGIILQAAMEFDNRRSTVLLCCL